MYLLLSLKLLPNSVFVVLHYHISVKSIIVLGTNAKHNYNQEWKWCAFPKQEKWKLHAFVLLRYFWITSSFTENSVKVVTFRKIHHAHHDKQSGRSLSPAMDSTVLTFAFSILCRKMECAKVSFVILRKDDNKTPVKLNNMIYILADTFPKTSNPIYFCAAKRRGLYRSTRTFGCTSASSDSMAFN